MDSSVSPTYGDRRARPTTVYFVHVLSPAVRVQPVRRSGALRPSRPGNVHTPMNGAIVGPGESLDTGYKTLRVISDGDAAFASTEVYEFLEARRLQVRPSGFRPYLRSNCTTASFVHLLKRPVGRPPNCCCVESTRTSTFGPVVGPELRRVDRQGGVALRGTVSPHRLHRHQPEPSCRAGCCVLQSARHCRAMDQGRQVPSAIKWTRLSCRSLRNNAVRLQLHALAYNLGNFMRTLALPDAVEQWSLTTQGEAG